MAMEQVKCPHCDRKLNGKRGLQIHLTRGHPDKPKSPVIPIAPRKSQRQKEKLVGPRAKASRGQKLAQENQKVAAEKPKNGFHCHSCPRTFRIESHLKRHQNVTHQSIEHQCNKCRKIFGTKRVLNVHQIWALVAFKRCF